MIWSKYKTVSYQHEINDFAQDCGNSILFAMELPQSCTKPRIKYDYLFKIIHSYYTLIQSHCADIHICLFILTYHYSICLSTITFLSKTLYHEAGYSRRHMALSAFGHIRHENIPFDLLWNPSKVQCIIQKGMYEYAHIHTVYEVNAVHIQGNLIAFN